MDTIIRGGRVVDGTGGPPRTADVAIAGGTIVEVGRVGRRAAQEIDADGLTVTPGFVDLHVHYDGQATWDEHLWPSTLHGVTTMVAGNCGVGFAPSRREDHRRLIELMAGIEDIPGSALDEGLNWEWQSFPEFLDHLGTRRWDADLGVMIPHAALRVFTMGERATYRIDATPAEARAMGELAAAAVSAGALGFSTSRTHNHRSTTGELTPTVEADHSELLEIAAAVGRTGTGVLQAVSDFVDLPAELGLFRSMAEVSGRPLSFSMADPHKASWPAQLEFLEQCQRDGLPVLGQAGARAIGVLLGLACSLHPLQGNPVYAEIAELPAAEQARIMADPVYRERLLRAPTPPPSLDVIADYSRLFELGTPPNYEPEPRDSIAARAARSRLDPLEIVYDVLRADQGRAMIYAPVINWCDGNLDAVGEMLRHPYTVPGLSDGGAHVGAICDASFPTSLMTLWSRDRARGRLPIEQVVRKQCRDTARAVGLTDRGVIEPGRRADINVLDYDELELGHPEVCFDLPAGGRRLLQRARGYRMTMVAGQVTYLDGEATGRLPGRLVRGAR